MKTLKLLPFVVFAMLVFVGNAAPPDYDNPDTGTFVYEFQAFWGRIPVICDGTETDVLYAEGFNIKVLEHWRHGQFIWYKILVCNISYTSQITGEEFVVQSMDRYSESDGIVNWRFNARGNMGSHYIGIMKSRYNEAGDGFELIEHKVNCH